MPLKEKAGDEVAGMQEIAVDAFADGDGLMLTIGHTSILLDRAAAQEILILLADALMVSNLRTLGVGGLQLMPPQAHEREP